MSEIENILRTNLDSWEVKRYSNTNDFQSLWELGNDRLDLDKSIIVIWDGFPADKDSSPVALEKFITPMDWVFAYLHKHRDLNSKIAILDIYSHECPGSIIEFHQRILEEIKIEDHILFYSFNKTDFEKSCNPLDIKYIEEVIDLLSPVSQTKLADLSREMWNSLIMNAADDNSRHSINNILDPLILGEYTLDENEFQEIYNDYSTPKKAFYNIFRWHNIVQAANRDNNQFNKPTLDEDTKIVLVDDQAKYGWESLLRKWVDGTIDSRKDAGFIIERLEEGNSVKLNLTGDNDGRDEILLFDLYLFPDDPFAEKNYFERVLGCIKQLRLKDPPLAEDEITKLSKKLQDNDYKDIKIDYLTLLPRLIAEIDPSIPIIIFSSTRADGLIELLEKYENISVFEKPSVIDINWQRNQRRLGHIRNVFGDEIEKAKQWIQKSSKTRLRTFIEQFGDNELPKIADNYPFTDEDKDNLRAKLYLDETGKAGINKEFIIGGIYIVGRIDDEQAWNQLGSQIGNIRKIDVKNCQDIQNCPGEQNCTDKRCIDREKSKRKRRIESMSLLSQLWGNNQFYVGAIQLTCNDQIKRQNGNVELFRNIINEVRPATLNRVDALNTNINQYCNNNDFTAELIRTIFKNYNYRHGMHDWDRDFNNELSTDENALDLMTSEYLDSREIHLKVLMNLINLFVYVVSPILRVHKKNIGVEYGTMARKVYSTIAKRVFREIGIGKEGTDSSRIYSYFVGSDYASIENPSLINDGLEVTGVKDEEVTIADIVVSLQNRGNIRTFTQMLREALPDIRIDTYKNNVNKLYARGMKVTMNDIKPFEKVNKYFYEMNYKGALESIRDDDIAWKSVENVIRGEPDTTPIHSYICNILARKYHELSHEERCDLLGERHIETSLKSKGWFSYMKKLKDIFTRKDKA